MVQLTPPPRFWEDHMERCGEHPGSRIVVKSTRSRVTVRLDEEAFANLKSDADHYANDGTGAAPRGLCISAATTLRAILNRLIDQGKDTPMLQNVTNPSRAADPSPDRVTFLQH
jgi:hypothetical protein